MATANGILSPPIHLDSPNSSTTPSVKRKRENSVESQKHTNGISKISDGNGATKDAKKEPDPMIQDLIDVLRSHDTSPSVLNHQLPDDTDASEPQAKRPKSEVQANSISILARLSSNTYLEVHDVLRDIDVAVENILEELQIPKVSSIAQVLPVPAQDTEIFARVSAFKKRAHELIRRERLAAEELHARGSPEIDTGTNDNKIALTMIGNHLPMFSSIQSPIEVGGEKIYPPVRDAGLPNGITTTRVLPSKSLGLIEEKRRVQTLGDLFPTPPSVRPQSPPKPAKNSFTRSSIVGWYQPDPSETRAKYAGYSRQPISVGQWLDYSGSSSGVKRKQRDRALSISGRPPSLDNEPVESEASKLEALFRSAYSGFAPTKDDTAALVPECQMSRLWWQRSGERAFERIVKSEEEHTLEPSKDVVDDNEMRRFQEAVADWDPHLAESFALPSSPEFEKSAEEKEGDEVLQDISELLETLNSYQRIRHMSLNASTRPAGLLSAPDTTSLGTPSKPSEPEQATYEMLKSQLALLIATLPPFAVAKLNSDKLGELGISSKIEVEVQEHKGSLQEDPVATKARAAAMDAAAASSPTPRVMPAQSAHRNSNASLYGNQYSSRTPSAGSQQYHGSSQTPVRLAHPAMARPPSSAPQQYQSHRASSSGPYRPQGYGTPTFQQPQARPVQQYANTNGQNYHQQTPSPGGYPRHLSQSYQQSSQPVAHPMMNRYPQQQHYTQQQKPMQNGHGFPHNSNAQYYAQQSPHRPSYSPSIPPAQSQGRPSYSAPTPTPSLPHDRRQSYMAGPMTGNSMMNGGRPSPSPSIPQSAGGWSTHMSSEEQASMMERQRAQLAQQQGMQQQARSAAHAGAMVSPSPPINGGGVPSGL